LQARECEFRLASGRKCRAAANRDQAFCRHHAPKPAVPAPPPIPKKDRYSDLSRWRQVGSQLHSMPLDEVPQAIWDILQCLVDRGPDSTGHISNLTAGRFLRAFLTRLGDVPFPDPDLALVSASGPTSWPGAIPRPPAFSTPQAPGSSAQDLSALFTGLGLPQFRNPGQQSVPSRAPGNQSRPRVNQ
jgi:hypothetical protein